MVGNESASLAKRPRRPGGRVHGRLQLELGVDLGAEQHDVESDV
jgi:hypothetical protein